MQARRRPHGLLSRCQHRGQCNAGPHASRRLVVRVATARHAPVISKPWVGAQRPLWEGERSKGAAVVGGKVSVTMTWRRSYKPLHPYAVDFRLSPEDAARAFEEHHKRWWLAPLTSTLQPGPGGVRPVFLPFWAFDATIHASVTGQVGFRVLRPEFNIRTRRMEMRYSIQWEQAQRHKMPLMRFHNNMPEMQVCATFAYKKEYVAAVKGQYIDAAKRMDASMMDGPRGEKRDVEPFEMYPSIARERVIADLKAQLLHDGGEYLRVMYNADQVQSVVIDFDFVGDFKPFPVYLPAYVIEYTYLGHNFRALVNGVNGHVGGERHYSALKAGGLTALVAVAGMASVGIDFASLPSLILAGLASVVGGVAARFYPLYAQLIKEKARVAEEALQKQQSFGWENQSFWREYGEHAKQQRQREQEEERRYQQSRRQRQQEYQQYYQQQQHQQQSGYGGGGGASRTRTKGGVDPEGYYRLLELTGKEGKATEDEIKSAFRRLAMKYHPDMQKTEQEKKKSAEVFKKIVTAYQVLRDKNKRRDYDLYGAP